jgi:hypothetical protein
MRLVDSGHVAEKHFRTKGVLVMKTIAAFSFAFFSSLAIVVGAPASIVGKIGGLGGDLLRNDKRPHDDRLDLILKMLESSRDDREPQEKKELSDFEMWRLRRAEKHLYQRLQDDGGITDPECPLVLYVRRIEGRKLIGVEFMRRDPSGKQFDLIGSAEQMEVRIDFSHQQLVVDARNLVIRHSAGVQVSLASKIFRLDLPSGYCFHPDNSSRPLRKEELPLSAEDRKFLNEGFPKEPRGAEAIPPLRHRYP